MLFEQKTEEGLALWCDPGSQGEAPACQNVLLQDLPDEVIKKSLRNH